jgi:hypothetical protein
MTVHAMESAVWQADDAVHLALALSATPQHGLPLDVQVLDDVLQVLILPSWDSGQDTTLTSLMVRYAMNVNAGATLSTEDARRGFLEHMGMSVEQYVADAVRNGMVQQALEELPPPHPQYAQLQAELAAIRADEGESAEAKVENQYTRVVRPEGNPVAAQLLEKYFRPEDTLWRGMGSIPQSGLMLRPEYSDYDVLRTHPVDIAPVEDTAGCKCGQVLQGLMSPGECPRFAKDCSPQNPVGPCMVSQEGACHTHFLYK